MHNTSKSNKKGKKCDTSRTRPKAIFVVYASSLSCLVSRRLAPTALKPFLLLWQKSKWQKYPFANVKTFGHFANEKHFCHLREQIQVKLLSIKRTCYLWNGQLATERKRNVQMAKSLQMDIFCHLDFCHNRRNCFWALISATSKWPFSALRLQVGDTFLMVQSFQLSFQFNSKYLNFKFWGVILLGNFVE